MPELPDSAPPAGRRAWLAAQARDPRRAWFMLGAAAIAGLLIGWVVLGWWLFPVEWTNAAPPDLYPAAQDAYLLMAAEDYAEDKNLAEAQARLADFEQADLAAALADLAARQTDPVAQQNLRLLAADLGLDPAAMAAGPEAEAGADGGLTGLARVLAWVALIAALGAGLALLATSIWLRRRELRPTEVVRTAAADDRDWRASAAAADQPTAPADVLVPPGRPAPRAAAGAWQPGRISLGQTVRAVYDRDQAPAMQSWLVYEAAAGDLLVGGAGLLARPVGEVVTVDLWFSEHGDLSRTLRTPQVTFITETAQADLVLRARLADQRLEPALPGHRCQLDAGDLVLAVTVEAAEADPLSHRRGLARLVLALRPERRLGGPPMPDLDPDADLAWEAIGDDELDEAFEPPPPVTFRRE